MARIRTIKPEFWQNEELAEVSETSRLVAIGLLNLSDDEGWFKAHARLIESALFPLTEPSMSVHECLQQLEGIGYISIHPGSDSKSYGRVVNFTSHQKVNRPSPSKIKPLIDFSEDSVSSHGSITVGKERKGKEQGKEQGTGNGDAVPAKPDYSDEDYRFAEWMLSLITEKQPDFKTPNLKSWAKTIRLMRERDDRNHRDMGVIWKWARNDDFWQANVLSADKFRKQYDRLVAQAMRPGSAISQAQKDAQREEEIQNGFLSDAPPDEEYHGGITIDHEEDDREPF